MSEPHFDPLTLSEVMGLHEPEERLHFLEFFVEHMEATLGSAPFVGDDAASGEFREKAHMLKSSCRSVGALLLGEVLEQLENAARTGDAALIQQECRQVHSVFAETLLPLREEIERLRVAPS